MDNDKNKKTENNFKWEYFNERPGVGSNITTKSESPGIPGKARKVDTKNSKKE